MSKSKNGLNTSFKRERESTSNITMPSEFDVFCASMGVGKAYKLNEPPEYKIHIDANGHVTKG